MSIKLTKKLDNVLIYSGELSEGQTGNFVEVDLTKFKFLNLKFSKDGAEKTELVTIPIAGQGKYCANLITYASNNQYIKSMSIAITNNKVYVEYAKEKALGTTIGSLNTFKLYKIFGVY